jgi:hypothetical protein
MPPETTPLGQNSVEAVLRATIYAGATSTFLLDGPAGEIKVFNQNREAIQPQAGSRYRVAWAPGDSVVVRG